MILKPYPHGSSPLIVSDVDRADIRGRIRVFQVDSNGAPVRKLLDRPNLIVNQSATARAAMISGRQATFGLYLEYQNLADPDDAVETVEPDVTDDIDTFTGLTDGDYLRTALASAPLIDDGTDEDYAQNRITLWGVGWSPGTGELGAPYSADVNSALRGAGLIMLGVDADSDLLFARAPLTKLLVPTSGGIGVQWILTMRVA